MARMGIVVTSCGMQGEGKGTGHLVTCHWRQKRSSIVVPIFSLGKRWRWVVTTLSLYTQEIPVIRCEGGWLDPTAGLGRRERSHLHRGLNTNSSARIVVAVRYVDFWGRILRCVIPVVLVQ